MLVFIPENVLSLKWRSASSQKKELSNKNDENNCESKFPYDFHFHFNKVIVKLSKRYKYFSTNLKSDSKFKTKRNKMTANTDLNKEKIPFKRRESHIVQTGSCYIGKNDVWDDEKFAKMFDRRLFLPGFVSP